MKKDKIQRKKFNIVPVLVPILSVAAAATVVTPIVVCASKKYVTLAFEGQRWAGADANGEKVYTFNLLEKIPEGHSIEIKPSITYLADTHCHVELVGDMTIAGNKKITQKLKIVRNDGAALVTEDRALFDLTFRLLNEDGKQVWKDTIYYMSIVYRVS